MIIKCKECGTKYRVDAAKIKPTGTKLRCSRCQHGFVVSHSGLKDEDGIFRQILSGRNVAEEAYLFRQTVLQQLRDAEDWHHPQG